MRDTLTVHRKVAGEMPRALQLFGRQTHRTDVSPAEMAQRVQQALPLIASGELPLDKTSLEALRLAAEQALADYNKMVKGEA